MSIPTRRLGRVLAALLLAGIPGSAQDLGFGAALKFRAGHGLAAQEDRLATAVGLGLELGYGNYHGRLGLEFGYQFMPGSAFAADPSAMAVAPGMTVDGSRSVDSRKNRLENIASRLSYQKRLRGSSLSLRLGAQIATAGFRQEYHAQVTNGTTYQDTYNGAVTHSSLAVSPFIGISLDRGQAQALELHLLALNYRSAQYHHVAGTVASLTGEHTAQDTVDLIHRSVPMLEIAYVLRF